MKLDEADLRRCRSCEAAIVWALTAEGRRMPVDAEPTPEGRLKLRRREDGQLGVEVVEPRGFGRRYRSHFATCPEANDWRRGR